ncbi:TPA: hypothetical protein ACXIJH_004923 [Serratia marcescens]
MSSLTRQAIKAAPALTIALPLTDDYSGQVLVVIENGKLKAFRPQQPGEIMATMKAFIELAERAGWTVKPPEEE